MKGCRIVDEKTLKSKGQGSCVLDTVHDVLVCAWYDKKRVLVGSTYAGIEPMGICKR